MADKEKIVNLRVKADTKQAEKSLDGLNKTTTQSKKGVSGLSKGFAGMKQAILSAVPALNTFKTALVSTGVGAFAVVLGSLASLFVKAGKAGAAFSKELSTLKAVSGSTADEMEVLSDQAKSLGSSTQFTAMEVVKLQTELAKLGFTVSDIRNSTPAILDLAASLEVSLAESAEFAGSVVRSFGLDTKDTSRVVDVMALSTSSSALNFEALRESLKLVAPTSKATNVSLEETTSLLAVLADRGLKGSIAGTGLSKTFIELNKKGITLEQGFDKVKNSANPLNTAIDLVGVVAGKTFLTLAEGADDLGGLEQKFIDAEGAAKRMAEIKLDNLAGDTTKLSSAWEGLLLRIEDGDGILNKSARGSIKLVTGAINSFKEVLALASHQVSDLRTIIDNGLNGTLLVTKGVFQRVGATISIFANKAKLAISEIPIIGKAIDVEEAESNIKKYEEVLSNSNERVLDGIKKFAKIKETIETSNLRFLQGKLQKLTEENDIKEKQERDKKNKELSDEEKEEAEKARQRYKKEQEKLDKFKDKLKKDAEDNKAKTDEEKLALDRERRLKELEDIKVSEAEKRQSIIDINAYYDTLEDELKIQRKEEKDAKDAEDRELLLEQESERRALELEAAQFHADMKMQIEDQYISHLQGLSGVLSTLAGENEALATAALVLEKGAAIAGVVISTTRANQDIIAEASAQATRLSARGVADIAAGNAMLASGNPMGAGLMAAGGKELGAAGKAIAVGAKGVTMNKIGAGISIAGIMATAIKGGNKTAKNGKANDGSGGGANSGGGSISTTTRLSDFQQSSFNSAQNEAQQVTTQGQAVANAQSSQPTRAYVTSREIFSGNSLERNRVGEAGF